MNVMFNATHHMQNKTAEERKAIALKAHTTRRRNKEESDRLRANAIIYRDGLYDNIRVLEENRDRLERMELLSKRAVELTNKTLLSEQEIVDSASKWKRATGVYFLVKGDKVVYVGQSVNVYSRIAQHQDKDFDRFAFVACDKGLLDNLESLYIHVLKPELNGNISDVRKHAPFTLDKVLQGVR
jgi:hypothetical protein